jgi:CheY-like chemotaxis protein
LRALIVDDNASNRVVLSQHLQLGRRSAVAVESSAAALAPAEQGDGGAQFDFALLDDQMPQMGGIEAGRASSRRGAACRHALVMLTKRDNHDSNVPRQTAVRRRF